VPVVGDNERDAGIRPEHEALLALAEKRDAERAIVRKAADPLFAELADAERGGDLSLAGTIYKRIAAHFDAAGFHGDAQAYRLSARSCTDRLRRRNWIAKKKGERG
jgi:hypothetical protein